MDCPLGISMSNSSMMESHNWIPSGSPQHVVKYTANSVDVWWTLERWNESRMCKQTIAWWDLNFESISWWVWMKKSTLCPSYLCERNQKNISQQFIFACYAPLSVSWKINHCLCFLFSMHKYLRWFRRPKSCLNHWAWEYEAVYLLPQ